MRLADRISMGRGMTFAFGALLAYGLIVLEVRDVPVSRPAYVALVVLTAIILALTTRARWFERLGAPVYLAVQVALASAAMGLAYGIVSLHYMPVISQATLACRRRTVLAIVVGLAVLHFAFGVYFLGVDNAVIELVAFSGVCAAVVALTAMAAAERRARAELVVAHARLAEHALAVEDLATVKERNRIARDVHDSLGHYLTVILVQLEAAATVFDGDRERARAAIATASRITREGLVDVRRSVAALREPTHQRPLPEALDALVRELAATGTSAELRVSGDVRTLPPRATEAVFRAAQEALTNVRKHAGAGRVDVALAYGSAGVELVVADDGHGAGEDAGGFGLVGVRERVGLLGGRMDATSAPGRGFTVRVEVPC